MKVIIPLAGKGTRLLPITKHVPKPLIRVAGRPVMDYVMDGLEALDVEELIFITGHLKEQVEDHVKRSYRIPARFVEQRVQDGTAGAINLARPFVDGPVLIIFVDTLFDADLSLVRTVDADGIIWAKEVEDYQRFGVIVTDSSGYMTRIVEKPDQPISRLANIGLYYIRDWQTLYDGIQETLDRPANGSEWYLTDAFQYMVERGSKIRTAEVGGWYDCGKVETLLETNEHLLANGRAGLPIAIPGVEVIEPVRIGKDVVLRECTIGPNVTIDDGARVESSVLRDTIVAERASISNCRLRGTLVGQDAVVSDLTADAMVIAHDEAAPAR